LDGLKIVKVACGGLAAGRGVIWLRVRLWVSVLGVEIRNSLNLLGFFFSSFRCYRYNMRYWLLLKFVDVSMSVVNLKDKVVDLLLEELDNCITLSDYGITLIALILQVDNSLIPLCDNFLIFRDQCLKCFYLSDLSVSVSVVTLSDTGQLTHTAAQEDLIVMLNIHESDNTTERLFS
jgi:hypothetical protein